jgi:predicted transcriptional regulator
MKKQEDIDCTDEIEMAHHIQHLFQYNYKNQWVDNKFLLQRNRTWTKVFNNLVKMGLIKRKRTFEGYQYKWVAEMPE